jgi:hypothetical protein
VLTTVAFAKQLRGSRIDLAGRGQAGVWALAARALAGDAVARTAVDVGGFDFDQVRDPLDERLLPGAIKYGGVNGLASLAEGGRTVVFGVSAAPLAPWMPQPPAVRLSASPASVDALAAALLGP